MQSGVDIHQLHRVRKRCGVYDLPFLDEENNGSFISEASDALSFLGCGENTKIQYTAKRALDDTVRVSRTVRHQSAYTACLLTLAKLGIQLLSIFSQS